MTKKRAHISAIRTFNRFYTNLIGVVDGHILDSSYSLTDARVLFEISHMADCTARKIMTMLYIDEGYLSRIISRLMKNGIVRRSRSPVDGRKRIIELTRKGRREFGALDKNSGESIDKMLKSVSEEETRELVRLMQRIMKILSDGGGSGKKRVQSGRKRRKVG